MNKLAHSETDKYSVDEWQNDVLKVDADGDEKLNLAEFEAYNDEIALNVGVINAPIARASRCPPCTHFLRRGRCRRRGRHIC